jgi:putative component of membrane protein insertase Oxa1/YidC/SpoIIIJ protein YidD
MLKQSRGMLSNCLKLIAPFVFLIDKLGLQFILNLLVIYFVQIYQKYLSPRKGFSCAYSKLYRDDSCSEYFRKIVKSKGLNKSIPLFQERLRECRVAQIRLKNIILARKRLY